MGVAIGIDAGGTKTLAILVDADGNEVGRAQSAGANPYDVGPEAARAALHIVLNQLMTGGNVRAVCLGASGVDREEDRAAAETRLRAFVPTRIATDIRNDAAAMLGIVGPPRPAMVVVADAGSISYGERADGEVVRAGGHGAALGDSGSGVALGIATLRHTADVLDGCEEKGPLAAAVIKRLDLKRATDIIARIRHPDFDEPLVEALGALLNDATRSGDGKATQIVDAESAVLARNAHHVAGAVRTEKELPVLLVGKVFGWIPEMRERVVAAVMRTGPVSIVESTEGVHGAARIALGLARERPPS